MENNFAVYEAVKAAFGDLRRTGRWAARVNFSCCGSCGHYELANPDSGKPKPNYAFFHEQENDRLFAGRRVRSITPDNALHIQWLGDAKELAAALRNRGLIVRDAANENETVFVTGMAVAR